MNIIEFVGNKMLLKERHRYGKYSKLERRGMCILTEQEVIFLYYSVEQTANRLNLCTKTIYKLIKDGRLKSHKLSPRCIRISDADIEEFMKGGTHDRIEN